MDKNHHNHCQEKSDKQTLLSCYQVGVNNYPGTKWQFGELVKEDFQTNSSSWDIQGRRNVWNWIKTLVKQFVFSSRLQISSWSLLVDSRSWKRGGENEVTSTETKGAGPPAVGDDGRHVSQQLLDRQQNRQNRSFWVRTHRPSERMERMKGGCPPAPLMCAGGLPPSLVQSRETGG